MERFKIYASKDERGVYECSKNINFEHKPYYDLNYIRISRNYTTRYLVDNKKEQELKNEILASAIVYMYLRYQFKIILIKLNNSCIKSVSVDISLNSVLVQIFSYKNKMSYNKTFYFDNFYLDVNNNYLYFSEKILDLKTFKRLIKIYDLV